MKFDVVTVGAATQDTFLLSREFAAETQDAQKYLLIPAATKVDIPDIAISTGGGGTNAAVTFARTGRKTACMAKVGLDGAGREVERELGKEKIHNFLIKERGHQTGQSVILKGPQGEDTLLSHRGAGYEYKRNDFSFKDISADWLYVTSLAGDLVVLGRLLKWASLQGVKVAVNPGQMELEKAVRLKRLLRQADVVILNHSEAVELFEESDMYDLFRLARRAGWHSLIVTDADQGSWLLDGSYVYRAGLYKNVKVIDRTGAGDAFGAGFVAAIQAGKSLEQALSFAAANATSVIGYIGAKAGILRNLEVDVLEIKVSVFES